MALSEEQKKKIEEEESYRNEVKGKLKKKKGVGCVGILLILFVIGIFFSLVVSAINPSKQIEKASQQSQSVDSVFDVPSLVGKNVDQVKTILLPYKKNTLEPTTQQIALGVKEWDMEFVKDGKDLLVTYNIGSRAIVDFFISTDDPSGKTTNTAHLLQLGNLKEGDSKYRIEFVKAIIDSNSFTGVKVIPL